MATTMNGALGSPLLKVTGDLSLNWTASLSIPSLTVDGVLDAPRILEGALSLPSFIIRSDLNWGASLDLPLFTVGGNLSVPIVLYGDLDLPAPSVSGSFKQELALYGDLDLPRWEFDGKIWAGVYMSGDITLPSLKVSGTLVRYVDSVYVGDLNMSAFEVSGIIDYTEADPTLIYSRGTACQV